MKKDDEDYDPYAPFLLTETGAALLKAVRENDAGAARASIKAHASCDRWLRYMSDEKTTLLHLAAQQGCLEVAKILIDHDPEAVHADRSMGGPPYGFLLRKKNMKMLQLLLDAGSDTRWGIGGAVDETKYGDPEIHRAIVKADRKFQLFDAVEKDDAKKARKLLESGIPPDPRDRFGYTPLIRAAKEGKSKVARVLLEFGADAHARAATGDAPLKQAVCGRHHDIVEMLGNAGASMREVENEYDFSALDFADDLDIPNVEPRLRDLIHRLDDAEMTEKALAATRLDHNVRPLKPLRLNLKR